MFGHRAKERGDTRRKGAIDCIQKLGLLINFAEDHLQNGIRRTATIFPTIPLRTSAYLCARLSVHFGVGCPADSCSSGTFFTLKRSISADTLL